MTGALSLAAKADHACPVQIGSIQVISRFYGTRLLGRPAMLPLRLAVFLPGSLHGPDEFLVAVRDLTWAAGHPA
jgi:hypothetical protein